MNTDDTPRTDTATRCCHGHPDFVYVEFARGLERENAQLRADKERLDRILKRDAAAEAKFFRTLAKEAKPGNTDDTPRTDAFQFVGHPAMPVPRKIGEWLDFTRGLERECAGLRAEHAGLRAEHAGLRAEHTGQRAALRRAAAEAEFFRTLVHSQLNPRAKETKP